MLQSAILLVFYFSTDSAAVIDFLFHGFRKSTETKKLNNFRTEFETDWSVLKARRMLSRLADGNDLNKLSWKPVCETKYTANVINKENVDTERE